MAALCISLAVGLIGAGCADPPPPDTARACGPSRGATAPHVCWAGPGPTGRPVALLVDDPGGPVDRLGHDADVATFLNDRFETRFATLSELGRTEPATFLLTPAGCLLTAGPITTSTPTDWIAAVNAAVRTPRHAPRHPGLDHVPGVGTTHPLTRPCTPPPH